MSNAYDKQLRCMAWSVSKEIGFDDFTREGVYVMVGGPTFETVGEARLLRAVGADAAGGQTRLETEVGRQQGCGRHNSNNEFIQQAFRQIAHVTARFLWMHAI